jgi:hypothetical protein
VALDRELSAILARIMAMLPSARNSAERWFKAMAAVDAYRESPGSVFGSCSMAAPPAKIRGGEGRNIARVIRIAGGNAIVGKVAAAPAAAPGKRPLMIMVSPFGPS